MGYKKGESGNPKGRPKKGTALTDLLEAHLDKEKFIKKLCDLAIEDGNVAAFKEILERLDGRVVQKQIIRNLTGIEELDNATDDELQALADEYGKDIQEIRSRQESTTGKKSEK